MAPSAPTSESDLYQGERKQATVLFSDLSGFTNLGERLDPEEVRGIMERFFAGAAKSVSRYGGTVQKYIGDAVVAVFGVPSAHEDDASRAVHAAREIHALVEVLSPEVERRAGQAIAMHSGINTGLVVTGVGQTGEGNMGVVGDTVNVASRLCSLAQPGEILVGADTHALTERAFRYEQLPEQRVKGKAEAVRVFKLLDSSVENTGDSALRGMRGLRAALTGRDTEMDLLRQATQDMRAGRGSVLCLSGEAGTGKSRLVEELRLAVGTDVQWLEGRAYDHTQGVPFFPVRGMLSQICGMVEGDGAAQVRAKLERSVTDLLGADTRALPYLGRLFSLEYEESANFAADYWSQQVLEHLRALFEALAQRRPTVFFMEDLHWADPSTVEFLRRVLPEFRQPAIAVCAYRPPFRLFEQKLDGPSAARYRELALGVLPAAQVQEMARNLLRSVELPQALLSYVGNRVGGNPFFLEELLNSLVENGTLRRNNGSWELTGSLEAVHLPATVQGVIAARLDRLEPQAKRTLQQASVIGQSFLYEVLHRVIHNPEALRGQLEDLELADMIRARSLEPDLEYMFKHPLTQEVVYSSILLSERAAIHGRVGKVMEEVLAERLPEFYETLALHFRNARQGDRAVDYLIRAGVKSLDRFALDEAHRFLSDAHDLQTARLDEHPGEVERLFDLLDHWALVYYYRGNFVDLEELLARQEVHAGSVSPAKAAMYYAYRGFSHTFTGDPAGGRALLLRGLEYAERSGDPRALAYNLAWLVDPCNFLGLIDDAVGYGKRAVKAADAQVHDVFITYKSRFELASAFYSQGDAGRARAYAQQALDIGEARGDLRAQVLGHAGLGLAYRALGDLNQSLVHLQRSTEIAVDPFYKWFPQAFVPTGAIQAGKPKEAELALEGMLKCAALGTTLYATLHDCFVGAKLCLDGRLSDGFGKLRHSQRQFRQLRWTYFAAVTDSILGVIYAKMAIGTTRPPLGFLVRNLGFLLLNLPRAARKAEEHFRRAAAAFGEMGAPGPRAQALLQLGKLYTARGRPAEALECLREAEGIFERMEATVFLAQTREVLAATTYSA